MLNVDIALFMLAAVCFGCCIEFWLRKCVQMCYVCVCIVFAAMCIYGCSFRLCCTVALACVLVVVLLCISLLLC